MSQCFDPGSWSVWGIFWCSPQLAFLDHFRGPLRWHISYNLLMLRMISFAMDWHWARLEKDGGSPATDVAAKTGSAGTQVRYSEVLHAHMMRYKANFCCTKHARTSTWLKKAALVEAPGRKVLCC